MDKKIKFLALFRSYIEYYRNPDLVADVKTKNTIKNYSVKYNNITEYLRQQKALHITTDQLTVVFVNKMVMDLKKKYSHNYATRTAEICKAVLTWATLHRRIKFNPLYAMRFKKEHPREPDHLTPDEVAKLETYTGKHQRIAELFLFQCYTGVDFGDLFTISRRHLIENPKDLRLYIIKAREKTGIEAFIPLFEPPQKIWQKYNYKFEPISNQKYNAYLKEICRALEINKRVTSHVGRKTFGMIKLNYENYSIAPLSKMLGHATIKTTEAYYAKVGLNSVSAELDRRGM